ncbi:Uncharacterised protein [Escherichia coli]|uniref:Uncharacterized protein n=1 Tax=Escherichia coli TaxID=562 RepID=A0A376CVC6_ECOLX|nr:Uncharacterised protein [Escherichia coli]
MQVVDHPFRVDIAGLNTQLQRTFWHRTDITDIAARSRQQTTNAIGFGSAITSTSSVQKEFGSGSTLCQ